MDLFLLEVSLIVDDVDGLCLNRVTSAIELRCSSGSEPNNADAADEVDRGRAS
jgi:hypothetical protein